MDLAAIQASFVAALEGTADHANGLFLGDPAVAERRVGLYRNDMHVRHARALAATYPVVGHLTGATFGILAREYASAHPSRSGNLNAFGGAFADFVAARQELASQPYLPDTARLAWMIHQAYYAAEAAPIPFATWREVSAFALAGARLTPHPACALLAARYAIDEIWMDHRAGGGRQPPDCSVRPTFVFVSRPDGDVRLSTTTAGGHAALRALADGRSLGAAIDAALAREPGFDLAHHLAAWIAAACFSDLRL